MCLNFLRLLCIIAFLPCVSVMAQEWKPPLTFYDDIVFLDDAELGMSSTQRQKVLEARQLARRDVAEIMKGADPNQRYQPESDLVDQRRERLRQDILALLTTTQRKKLRQYTLQQRLRMGGIVWVLKSETIDSRLEQLNLSDEQFAEVVARHRDSVLIADGQKQKIRQDFADAMLALGQDLQRQLAAELTEKQIEALSTACGMPFTELPFARPNDDSYLTHNDDRQQKVFATIDIVERVETLMEIPRFAEHKLKLESTAEVARLLEELTKQRDAEDYADRRRETGQAIIAELPESNGREVVADVLKHRYRSYGFWCLAASIDVEPELEVLKFTPLQTDVIEAKLEQLVKDFDKRSATIIQKQKDDQAFLSQQSHDMVFGVLNEQQQQTVMDVLGMDPRDMDFEMSLETNLVKQGERRRKADEANELNRIKFGR